MYAKIIAFCLTIIIGNSAYAGEILRCVAANGDVMFTNIACPANSKVQHVASYTPVPDVPAATYNTPSFATSASTGQAQTAQQARAAYAAGYEQARAETQDEQSSDDTEYAGGWIPFYPVRGSHLHDRHHRPWQPMVAHAPPTRVVGFAPHR